MKKKRQQGRSGQKGNTCDMVMHPRKATQSTQSGDILAKRYCSRGNPPNNQELLSLPSGPPLHKGGRRLRMQGWATGGRKAPRQEQSHKLLALETRPQLQRLEENPSQYVQRLFTFSTKSAFGGSPGPAPVRPCVPTTSPPLFLMRAASFSLAPLAVSFGSACTV
jgi:hypothetical protein